MTVQNIQIHVPSRCARNESLILLSWRATRPTWHGLGSCVVRGLKLGLGFGWDVVFPYFRAVWS